MRVAVVSPVTIHHRDADDTRRLQRLVRGLAERDHDVTVCCARWWDAEGESVGVAGPDVAVPVDEESDGDETNDAAEGSRHDAAEGAPGDAVEPAIDAADADEVATGRFDDAVSDGAGAADAVADPDELPPAGTPAEDATEAASSPAPEADDDAPASVPTTVTVDGVTYRAVCADPTNGRRFATRAPLSIRRARPDVIHAVAAPPSTVAAARAGGTLARAPVLAEWYDPSREDPEDWATRHALGRARRIVTPSRLTRRQLLELGADDERLRVVSNAIDYDKIEAVEPTEDADVVYARRLDEDANLESLLLGLAELRDRDWRATIVGDGPERAAYEQQVRELRIDDRVTFAGACDRETRLGIYRGAHAFVQTARHCVFATELLWALACGCVGIVEYHAASSAHELVEGRDRGFRTTNPQETAQAILDAGDFEHRTVDETFESFDEPAVLAQYEALYEQVREEWGFF